MQSVRCVAKKIKVPFEPDDKRPVYCKTCLGKSKEINLEKVAKDFVPQKKENKIDLEGLKEILKEWLADAKVLIDKHIKRDLTEEIANETDHNKLARLQKDLRICNNAALRITANMVSQAYMRRNSPYVRENDYNIKKNDDTIFTQSIKDDLDSLIQTPVNTSNSGVE